MRIEDSLMRGSSEFLFPIPPIPVLIIMETESEYPSNMLANEG